MTTSILARLMAGVSNRALCSIGEAGGDGGAAGGGGGAAAGAAAAAPAAGAAVKVEGGAAGGASPAAGEAGAAAGEAKPAGTLASGAEGAAAAAAAAKAPATFPDNWRAQLAGDDKAALARLERFGSPNDIWKAYRELEAKLSSGELKGAPKPPPGKDAKPEEVAAWRKEAGIPEKPEDYKIELGNGVVVGEADKPLVENFLKHAHANNMSPATVNQALAWYYQLQDAQVAQRLEADESFHTDSTVALKQEWGNEFKGNINAVTSVLNMFPENFRSSLEHARTPDGQKLGDHPDFNRALLQLAKTINPASTLLPAAAGGGLGGVDTRIAEIEGIMRDSTKSDQYWKGEGGAKMQAEYRQLLEARDTMKKRQAA